MMALYNTGLPVFHNSVPLLQSIQQVHLIQAVLDQTINRKQNATDRPHHYRHRKDLIR
jgi:hypothetical protein